MYVLLPVNYLQIKPMSVPDWIGVEILYWIIRSTFGLIYVHMHGKKAEVDNCYGINIFKTVGTDRKTDLSSKWQKPFCKIKT